MMAFLNVFPTGLAQETYQDPQDRFAIDLPKGWNLTKEQFNLVYQFGSKGVGARFIIVCYPGDSDRAEVFAETVESLTASDLVAPPPDTVVDMTLNDRPARWAEYESPIQYGTVTIQMHVFVGAVVSEEDDLGVGFSAFMGPATYKRYGESIRDVFQSIRLHGRGKTGVSGVSGVAAPEPGRDLGPSTFEHALITLDIPADWTAKKSDLAGEIATLQHNQHGSIAIMGAAKDKLGKKPDDISESFRTQLKETLPTMKPSRDPWKVQTAGCGTAALEQFEAAITAHGQEVKRVVVIATVKDRKRGIGFVATFPVDVKDNALKDVLSIIQSAR